MRMTEEDHNYQLMVRQFTYDTGKMLYSMLNMKFDYNIETLGYFMTYPTDKNNVYLYRVTSLLAVRLSFGTLTPEFILRCANIGAKHKMFLSDEIIDLQLKRKNYKKFKLYVDNTELQDIAKKFAMKWFIFGCRYNGHRKYLSKEVEIWQ